MAHRTAGLPSAAALRMTLGAALLAASLGSADIAIACQEGMTPTPDVPHPDECRVEPRALPLFPEATAGGPATTPAPLPTTTPFATRVGDPADEATVAAVTATVREAVACRTAGDHLRAYPLVTDRFLGQLVGGPDMVPPEVAMHSQKSRTGYRASIAWLWSGFQQSWSWPTTGRGRWSRRATPTKRSATTSSSSAPATAS